MFRGSVIGVDKWLICPAVLPKPAPARLLETAGWFIPTELGALVTPTTPTPRPPVTNPPPDAATALVAQPMKQVRT